jgi:hypothetical protein
MLAAAHFRAHKPRWNDKSVKKAIVGAKSADSFFNVLALQWLQEQV